MTRREIILPLLAFLLVLIGCAKQDGSVNSIRELVDKLEAANSNASSRSDSLKVQVDFSGTLIFASPHSTDGRQAQLAAAFGATTAEKLRNKTGLSESFQIFLVSTNGPIKTLRWDKPLFVFNDLFMVKCHPGDYINFDIHEKTLRGIRVEHQ